jgi:hypothetical protein
LFSDRWKPLARGVAAGQRSPQFPSARNVQAPGKGLDDRGACARNSNALEQFFAYIQNDTGVRLLDLSGASQANIGFITNLGYKLYSDDLLQTMEMAFGNSNGDFYENQMLPEKVEEFLAQALDFPEGHFDGALLWDALEFMAPPLLKAVVDRLFTIVKPRSYLLAIFHADEKAESIPAYYYRIADAKTLLLAGRGSRKPAQFFNNRAVEKLFQPFESVKFFLSRDALREVIVKR